MASEAKYVTPDMNGTPSDSPSPSPQSPPTRFRLYTPASYILDSGYPSGSGSTSKARQLDDPDQDAEGETEEMEPDMDVEVDMDVDMEDDDEDYEDDDDLGDCDADADADGEGDVELGAEVEGLSMDADASVLEDAKAVDGKGEMVMVMDIECRQGEADKENGTSIPLPTSSQSPPSTSLLGPSGDLPATPGSILAMPIPPAFTLPLRPQLPPLSSLHVPVLSEPPRAFMGRGTPPDPRRRVEWSISGHYPGCQSDGIGVGLYLSTTHMSETGSSQRNPGDETVGIVPLPVSIMHSMDAVHEHTHDHHLQPENRQQQQSHQHAGEWTSFLYAMLEGSDMNVCPGAGISSGAGPSGSAPGNVSAVGAVAGASQGADPAGWYELGLGAVHMSGVVSGVPLSHHHLPVDDASSSTLRFALG